MGTTAENAGHPRPPRPMTQWLFRPYWKRVRIQLGDRLYVSTSPRGPPDSSCSGRLRFWGKIHCAAGYWAGVELDLPKGQNDGTVDGRRYFLCPPKRGLFLRISRCRTRSGHSVNDGWHVSFPSRKLGNKVVHDRWGTSFLTQNVKSVTSVHNAREASAPPYLSEGSRRDRASLAFGNDRQMREERSADARLNSIKWVPVNGSETYRGGSRCFTVDARRHDVQLESDSSECSSSGSTSSGSDRSQIDLDRVLDEVLAAPMNREGIAEVARVGEVNESGSCSGAMEEAGVKRRREALINSYAHWANRRDTRRKRDQARSAGAVSFSDHPSTQRTVAVALEGGGTAMVKRKQDASEAGTLLVASDHGRSTMNMGVNTGRSDRNERALVLLSASAGGSRRLLLHQSFGRARDLPRGDIVYDLPRGPSVMWGTPRCRGLPPLYRRPSQPEAGVLHAPPAPAEVTERALAIVTSGHGYARSVSAHPRARALGAGVCVVACAAPATDMPPMNALSKPEVAGRSLSKASPEARTTATAPGWPEGTKLAIKHPLNGSWLEPWSICSRIRACQQDLSHVEMPLTGATAIVRRSYIGEGVAVPPNAEGMLQAREPAKPTPTCLPRSTSMSRSWSQRGKDTQLPAGAESKVSSGNAQASARGDVSVADQQEGDETTEFGEEVVHRSVDVDDNKSEGKGSMLSTTCGGTDSGELRASIGQGVASVSLVKTPGCRLMFPERPQTQAETQPPTAGGSDMCGLATPPLHECLQLSPPCKSSLLPLAAPGDSVAHQSERDHAEQAATPESAPAAPAKHSTRGLLTTKPSPAGRAPAASSSPGFTRRPPLSSPPPRSPPPIRPEKSAPPTTAITDAGADLGSSVGLFSTDIMLRDTNGDDDELMLSAPVVHRRRHEDHKRRWSALCAALQGRAASLDRDREPETPACKPVPTQATPCQGKHEKSAETVPATGPEQNDTAADSCQTSPPALQRRQASESTTDFESRGENRSRSSEPLDGSESAGKERRQRHREWYPPPPGPPPSPIPSRRRRKVPPTRCGRSRSPSWERHSGASERDGDRRRDTAVEETGEVTQSAIGTITSEDDNSYASLRQFQARDKPMPTHGQEDAALLDLAGVAMCWLPPPTPPPPEARRRRRARQPSSQMAPPLRVPRVDRGTRSPPPPLPFPHIRGEEEVGEKEPCWSERPKETDREDQTGTRREISGEGDDEREPKTGHRRSGARQSGGEAPGITRAAGSGRNIGGEESSSLSQGGNRNHRQKERKGGWANSYEGSAAKRRADEVLARIAALELSFDRVEERAVAAPPTNAVRGGSAFELKKGRVQNDSAARALDALAPADATTSNAARMSIPDTAEEERGVPRTGLPIEERRVDGEDNVGIASGASCRPPPLSNESRSQARQEREKAISYDGPHATMTGTGSLYEVGQRPGQNMAFPVAMHESDHPLLAGRSGDSTQQQHSSSSSEFYFNLGRRMMLDSIE